MMTNKSAKRFYLMRKNSLSTLTYFRGRVALYAILQGLGIGAVKPKALNLGIRESKGDVVIRIDAHAIYEQGYIEKAVYYLYNYDATSVGGYELIYRAQTHLWQSASLML